MAADIGDFVQPRRLGPATMVAIAGVVLAVLLVSGLGIGLLIAQWRVREELEKIRAEGEPVTAADLEAFYSLPPGSRDTTALWLWAIDAVSTPEYAADAAGLPLIGDASRDLPEPDQVWPQQPAAEHFLAKHSDLLMTLHEAAAIDGAARYPTNFVYDDAASSKRLHGLRSICRLLAIESDVHVRRGDGHAAARSVGTILALAKSLDGEPTLVALLLRLAKDGVAVDRLQRLLALEDLSDGDLAAIDARLSAVEYYSQLHRAMLGARVTGMRTFDNPETLGSKAPATAVTVLFRQADRAVYLRIMREVVAASAATDQLSLQTAMDDVRDRIRETFEAPSASWRWPVSKLSLFSLSVFADAVGRGTARRDVARCAIAVERFRRAKGRLPAALDDLVPGFLPQAPIDPFDGAPLRWVVSGDEYRIYSVGPDGADQGGKDDESTPSSDIVLRVPLRKNLLEKTAEE